MGAEANRDGWRVRHKEYGTGCAYQPVEDKNREVYWVVEWADPDRPDSAVHHKKLEWGEEVCSS